MNLFDSCNILLSHICFLSHLFHLVRSYDDRFMILEDIVKKNKSLPFCSVSFIKTIRIFGIWTMTLASNNRYNMCHNYI